MYVVQILTDSDKDNYDIDHQLCLASVQMRIHLHHQIQKEQKFPAQGNLISAAKTTKHATNLI
jgi:hypothetical protein